MMDKYLKCGAGFIVCLFLVLPGMAAVEATDEISGWVSAEGRLFTQDALNDVQHDGNISVSAQVEYVLEWEDGGIEQSVVLTPYGRWDEGDEERSHWDMREGYYQMVTPEWEFRVGNKRVFWGVTEFLHLVDTINQIDGVDNLDAEDRLGQPMINLAIKMEYGTLSLFAMPYFRERTFPGNEGRLRTARVVETDRPVYEDPDEDEHWDYAVRWSETIGAMDLGLAWFSGTNRDPKLIPGLSKDGLPALVPYYDLMDQYSVDLQLTLGQWLWKLEALHREDSVENYFAATGGLEYTFVGVGESAIDLGLLAEYMVDDRDDVSQVPFHDDLFAGLRLTFNNAQSSEMLAGASVDMDTDATIFYTEAYHRLGDSWSLAFESWFFESIPVADPLYALRDDDYVQLSVAKYF